MALTSRASRVADPQADVVIEIGELDLTDVPPGRRRSVVAAFERELTRLVEAGPDGGGSSPRLRARPDGNPVLFGVELARAVHRRLP
ncbi:MAG: hypothetical protein IR158_03165 [Cellulomonas sp.]|jgi:hypothetical protein|uniref:hypothetical protein n=1 Tax=Cellulomonas sp. TaxID=40001 RepID=UPI0019FD27E6|nr:hypothetical protein [Cellulomonas sp.]MBF0686755.1 hypothetical protein [Cellulomonas sp.]